MPKQAKNTLNEREVTNLIRSMLIEFDGSGGSSGSSGSEFDGTGGSSGEEGVGDVPAEYLEDFEPIIPEKEKETPNSNTGANEFKKRLEKIKKDDLDEELGFFETTGKMLRGFFSSMVEDIERASFYDNKTTYQALENVDIAKDITGEEGRETVINQQVIKYYFSLYSHFNPSKYGCSDKAVKLDACTPWGEPIFNSASINPKILNIMKSPNAINVFLKGAKDRYKSLEKMALKRVDSPDSSTPEDPDFVFEQGSFMGAQPELGAMMNPDPEVRKLGVKTLLKQAEILGLKNEDLIRPRQKDYMRLYNWFVEACKRSFTDQGVGQEPLRFIRSYAPNTIVTKYLLVGEEDARNISKHAADMTLHPELFLICCLNSWHSFSIGDSITKKAMENLHVIAQRFKREVSEAEKEKAKAPRRTPKKYKPGFEGFFDALLDEIPGMKVASELRNLNQPNKEAWLSDYRISNIIDRVIKKQYKKKYLDDLYKFMNARSNPRLKEKFDKSFRFHNDLEFYNKLSRISPNGDLPPSRLRWIEREISKNEKIKNKKDPNQPLLASMTAFFIVGAPDFVVLSRLEQLAIRQYRAFKGITGPKTFRTWRIPLLWFATQMAFYFIDPINKLELGQMLKKFDETHDYLTNLVKRKFKQNQDTEAQNKLETKIQKDFERQLQKFLESPLAKANNVTREQALKLFYVQILDYKGQWTGAYKLASIDDEGKFKEEGQKLGTKWNDEDLSSAGDIGSGLEVDHQYTYEELYDLGLMTQDDYDQIDAPGMGASIYARHSADEVNQAMYQTPPTDEDLKAAKFGHCFDPKTYDYKSCGPIGTDQMSQEMMKAYKKYENGEISRLELARIFFLTPMDPSKSGPSDQINTKRVVSRLNFENGDWWQPENPNDLHTMHSPFLRKPKQLRYKDLRSQYQNLSDDEFEEIFGNPMSDKYQGPMKADDAPDFIYKPFYSKCSRLTGGMVSDEEIENSLPWVLEKSETANFVQKWKSSFDQLNVEVISAVQQAYLGYSSRDDASREIIEEKLRLLGALIELIASIKSAVKDYSGADLVITSENCCELLYAMEKSILEVEKIFNEVATPDTMLVPFLTPGSGEAKIEESYILSNQKESNYNIMKKNNQFIKEVFYSGESSSKKPNLLNEIFYSGDLLTENTQQKTIYLQNIGKRLQAYDNFNSNVGQGIKKIGTNPSDYKCDRLLRVFLYNEFGAGSQVKRRDAFALLRSWANNDPISLRQATENREDSRLEYQRQYIKDSTKTRKKYEKLYENVRDRDGKRMYFGKGSLILKKQTPFYNAYIIGYNHVYGPGNNKHVNAFGSWVDVMGSFSLTSFDEQYESISLKRNPTTPSGALKIDGRQSGIRKLIAKYTGLGTYLVPNENAINGIKDEIEKVRDMIRLTIELQSDRKYSSANSRFNSGLKATMGRGRVEVIKPAQIRQDLQIINNLEVYLLYLQTVRAVRKDWFAAAAGLADIAVDNQGRAFYNNLASGKTNKISNGHPKRKDHENKLFNYIFTLDRLMRIEEHYRVPQ